jgi:tetratricopeptide (TPR) repeat protein
MESSRDAIWKRRGLHDRALLRLFEGKTREAVEMLDEAIRAYDERGRSKESSIYSYTAHVLLEKGMAGPALEKARLNQRERNGEYAEREGLFFEALAQARLGRMEAALQTAEELLVKAESVPTEIGKRLYHHLQGELALARGDRRSGLEELEQAESMLSPRGLTYYGRRPQHIPIWFSLGRAYLETGQEDQAAPWFQRIIDSTTERVWWPIPYVRSFYFLGKIHENQGDMDKAHQHYRRFYEYWKDGDLDRERVEELRSKLEAGSLTRMKM